jgi:uroporphyrinogen-III synthase
LKIQRTKTGVDFVTFLSPEASRAILEYLDYRSREVKEATPKRINQL